MGHLETDKFFDLARCFYRPKIYQDIELYIKKQLQGIKKIQLKKKKKNRQS